MSEFNWSAWTNEQYPATESTVADFHALVKLAVPSDKSHAHNRQWIVKRGPIVLGHGFTYGTKTARNLCEMILSHEGCRSLAKTLQA
jgi:hypothetical protein